MIIIRLLKICIIFFLGFLSANLISYYFIYGAEIPFSKKWNFTGYYFDKAPFDHIKENQIEVYNDRVVIYVNNASMSKYAATGSMKPTFDENANGIRIVPKSPEDIHIGDIITYSDGKNLIVHRVIEIGEDSKGIYFITKGDNNTVSDGKIRFSDIKFITIGIIW
ncbi:MAG: signal peptidase I [Candidatus Pacearchaeota archaeon]